MSDYKREARTLRALARVAGWLAINNHLAPARVVRADYDALLLALVDDVLRVDEEAEELAASLPREVPAKKKAKRKAVKA